MKTLAGKVGVFKRRERDSGEVVMHSFLGKMELRGRRRLGCAEMKVAGRKQQDMFEERMWVKALRWEPKRLGGHVGRVQQADMPDEWIQRILGSRGIYRG